MSMSLRVALAFVALLPACSTSPTGDDAGSDVSGSDVSCGGAQCVVPDAQPAACPPCRPDAATPCSVVGTTCDYADGCYYASECTCTDDAGADVEAGASWFCLVSL